MLKFLKATEGLNWNQALSIGTRELELQGEEVELHGTYRGADAIRRAVINEVTETDGTFELQTKCRH